MTGRIMTRMTTDVDAMSTFLQTGLITMVNSGLTFVGVLVALLLINVKLGLTLFTVLPVLIVATVWFRVKSAKAYAEAREKVSRGQRGPAGERRRAARGPGLPARAGQPCQVRGPVQRLPAVPDAGPALHLAVLPVRAGAVHHRGRADPVHGRERGAQRHPHRRRPDRVPALHRHAVLPGPADVPGLRRLPAGLGRRGPDLLADAHPDDHARGRAPDPGRPPARRDRARRRALQVPDRTQPRRSAGSACGSRRARRWRSSARPARASPPWSSSSPGSTT